MNKPNYTITLSFDKSPAEVFAAIQNVSQWWSEEIEGQTKNAGDEFTYHFEDLHYCQIKLTEVVENRRIGWLVKYNYFKHTKDKSEWTGTTIDFDIHQVDGKTELLFTHFGLNPEYECYEVCINGWNHYVGKSLANLINTGKGMPNATGKARTESERAQLAK